LPSCAIHCAATRNCRTIKRQSEGEEKRKEKRPGEPGRFHGIGRLWIWLRRLIGIAFIQRFDAVPMHLDHGKRFGGRRLQDGIA
jgi:hypothetical protein